MNNLLINLGDKIELTKKIDTDNLETYHSMVYDVIDQEHILIQAPIEGGKIIPLEMETVYYACIFTKNGLYRGEVQVTKRMKDERLHFLELTFITSIKKFQRRQHYRMNCILNFKYKDQDDDHWDTGTVLDISGGGLRFSNTKEIQKDVVIRCHLNLHLREYEIELDVDGIVLQSIQVDSDTSHYQTRVSFLDMSTDDTEKIIKFIFEEERRRRKKEKGL